MIKSKISNKFKEKMRQQIWHLINKFLDDLQLPKKYVNGIR